MSSFKADDGARPWVASRGAWGSSRRPSAMAANPAGCSSPWVLLLIVIVGFSLASRPVGHRRWRLEAGLSRLSIPTELSDAYYYYYYVQGTVGTGFMQAHTYIYTHVRTYIPS